MANQCAACGRRYNRSYCEFCQREARWWDKYFHKTVKSHLPPRLQRDVQAYADADLRDWPQHLRDGGGLYFHGGVGSGKTTTVCLVCLHTVRLYFVEGGRQGGAQGWPRDFTLASTQGLLEAVRATYDNGSDEHERQVFARYAQAELLILDDLDDISPTDWAVQMIDSIIDYRYEHLLPTAVTANADLDELPNTLGQDRIPSRLREMCHQVHFNSEDKRTGDS